MRYQGLETVQNYQMLRPLVSLTTGASELVLLDLDSSIPNLRISSKQKIIGKEADESVNE